MNHKMIPVEPSRYFKRTGDGISVSRSLPFVESMVGKYTHRVRHVTLHTCRGVSHLAVQCWCGMGMNVDLPKKNGRLVAAPGEGRPMCAGCEGRAMDAKLPSTPDLLYTKAVCRIYHASIIEERSRA